MSLELKLVALAQAIGQDVKALKNADGDLSSLPTTIKTNLVGAITEIHTIALNAGVKINDTATTGAGSEAVAWSAKKISQSLAAAKSTVASDILVAKNAVKAEILDGAGAALDTLKELADALGNDPNFAATIATEIGNRVRFDTAQVLTTPQKLQACENIGVGNPEHDFLSDYTTAKTAL